MGEMEAGYGFMEAAALLVGLPVPAKHVAGVRMNLERIEVVARPLLAEPVGDEIESAQVFEP